MKIRSLITLSLGIILVGLGVFFVISGGAMKGLIPMFIGAALCGLGLSKSRVANLVFGHAVILVGCYLTAWGMYLLPYSEPKLAHIFGRPLFWGLFAIFGGICAVLHGFCNCILKRTEDK